MTVRELIQGADVRRVAGDLDADISGITYDSRRTQPGHLFFSLARDPAQRRANLIDAFNRGARAAVVDEWVDEAARPAVTLVECERPRLAMGAAAARLFHEPSSRLDLVGVTGTSGKTTTTYVLASIFEAAGLPAGIIGTIGTFSRSQKLAAGLTTPESVDIESALAAMESEGVRSVAAEVSSIGIAEGRVDWLNFRAAIFTNFGRDHLDYHRTSEEYFAAKLRLFSEILPRSKRSDAFAVVNASDPYGRRILEATSVRKFTFGSDNSSDAFAESIDADLSGIRARVSVLGKRIDIESPMVGEFNLMNILAASTAGVAMGIDAQAVAEGVRRCPGAPGRMEAVAAKAGVSVIVDYAHKPDALEAVLSALHRLAPGRLICVFGCGGDRDRGKRPIMGGIAARLADLTIITSDNPRSEDPIEIIREIERGAIEAGARTVRAGAAIPDTRVFIVEPDRRAAIYRALSIAQPGDAVVIAGKGHEDYQIVGSRIAAFDDRSVAREIGAGMRWQNR